MNADTELQRHVLDELDWDPSIDASQIGVTAKAGVVTLTGHVPTYTESLAAADVAKRVHGVRAVANEIEVRPPDSHRRDDADLAAAVLRALEWDAAAPHERIQVTVRDGQVILEGTLDWQFQKTAVERAVRNLVGIRGVTNAIVVRSDGTADEIVASIEAALRRSATLRARKVRVDADDRTVILSGDVHSLAERDEAERAAWCARGVLRVENCLTVTPWGSGPAEEWGY